MAAGATRAAVGVVVGFGDSVAAGYGLSLRAESNPGALTERFFGGDASCNETLEAYPCVLAGEIGDNVAASRHYAVQGAQSYQVLDDELPLAKREISAAERQQVNVVTLTVGPDDLDFASCIRYELLALHDPCLAGSIGHLEMSPLYQHGFTTGGVKYDGLDGLEAHLDTIIPDLEASFPRARVYANHACSTTRRRCWRCSRTCTASAGPR